MKREYKWEFKDYPFYKITSDKKVINTKTGRVIKCCLNGGSIGYWIGKRFLLRSKINNMVLLCEKEYKYIERKEIHFGF